MATRGPVVQSIVCLTSSLVVKLLTVLVSTIFNSQVFVLKKMWVAFAYAKPSHIFSSKNISIYAIFNDPSFNDTPTNDIVSFKQFGPERCTIKLYEPGHIISYKTVCAPDDDRSGWASVQTDQSLRCPSDDHALDHWLPVEYLVNTLIRLCRSAGWSESSLGLVENTVPRLKCKCLNFGK